MPKRTASFHLAWIAAGLGILGTGIWIGLMVGTEPSPEPAPEPILTPEAPLQVAPAPPKSDPVRDMVASEDMILLVTPLLGLWDRGALNLRLPGEGSGGLFMRKVLVRDLVEEPPGKTDAPFPRTRRWKIGEDEQRGGPPALDLWRPFLDKVDYFEHAHFKVVRGRFPTPDHAEWEADVGFQGVALAKSGNWWGIKASLQITWSRHVVAGWSISKWILRSFKTTESPHRFFEEVLDQALPDHVTRGRARTSIHEKLITDILSRNESDKPPDLQFASLDRHPAVSVVDIDQDGFDDIYVMARWGTNMLLRNRGDGTFEEIASKVGLDIKSSTSCALFADFDNDGDPDVLLGRTLKRSLYLINEGGNFVDRSEDLVDTALPHHVSAVSAADYDGDGLLDLYISTYAALQVKNERDKGRSLLLKRSLPPDDSMALTALSRDSGYHHIKNRPGPPNILLKNAGGGRFTVQPEPRDLRLFRNTYQSTWGDFDGDGDPDLYCANDFSPNNLFRNEGGGRFVDVTAETETADIGYGMGASWGDYDNDGRLDLYVTNMFSKAGRRITAQLKGIDPQLAQMAWGNSLFHNAGDRFERASGANDELSAVAHGGWGWGSQFVDVNNDGLLDIYALSGYYTSPVPLDIPVDD